MGVDEGVLKTKGLAVVALTTFGFYGDFLALVASPPAALVAGLAQGDAINPGAQAGVAIKSANPAVNLDEDILGQVSRVRYVRNGARNQAVYGLVILRDQPCERLFRTGFQFRDNPGFFRGYAEDAGDISQSYAYLHAKVLHTITGSIPLRLPITRSRQPAGNQALFTLDTTQTINGWGK